MGEAEKQPSIKHRLSSFHPQANTCAGFHQNKENAELVEILEDLEKKNKEEKGKLQ